MTEARSMLGTTRKLGEGPLRPAEPAQKNSTDQARPQLGVTDNAIHFPLEGCWSNRPDRRDNGWTLRILTRSQPSPAASRRRQEGWVRQKQWQSRYLQSDGLRGQCRFRL